MNYNFTGVLAYDQSSNDQPLNNGLDWADVCTVVPVQAAPGSAFVLTVQKGRSGKTRITVPVPPGDERMFLKAFGANATR